MSDQLWSEEISQYFIDYAAYFVHDRAAQLDTICALLPARPEPLHVVELCCGEGLLARTILERFPECLIHEYDGSDTMLERARTVLQPFGERFTLHPFNLAAADWRSFPWPVVSSLAIHHLNGNQKRELYRDLYQLIDPGGALIIADLIQPVHPAGVQVAARAWDEAVRQEALARDGNLAAFGRGAETVPFFEGKAALLAHRGLHLETTAGTRRPGDVRQVVQHFLFGNE